MLKFSLIRATFRIDIYSTAVWFLVSDCLNTRSINFATMAGNSTSRGHLSRHVASSPIHPFRRSRVLTLSFLFSSLALRSSSHAFASPLVSFSSSSGALVKVSLFERRLVRIRFVSRRLLEVFWFLRVPRDRTIHRETHDFVVSLPLSLCRVPKSLCRATHLFSRDATNTTIDL